LQHIQRAYPRRAILKGPALTSSLSVGAANPQVQAWQSMFQRADANADGSLSMDEFTAAAQARGVGAPTAAGTPPAPPGARSGWGAGGVPNGALAGLHRHHHGHHQVAGSALSVLLGAQGQDSEALDSATVSDALSKLIGVSDSDGDGKLTLTEFAAADETSTGGAPSPASQSAFTTADADSDGFVTSDELGAAVQNALQARLGANAQSAYARLIDSLERHLPAAPTSTSTTQAATSVTA
jgi:Ca2+-binding EF-hand superfamily protein